jgi:hypothetical protein
MMLPGERFWPYSMNLGCELTGRQKEEIQFLDTALQDGLSPSTHDFGFSIRSVAEGREADIIRRRYTLDWWELILFERYPETRRVMSGFITGFGTATSMGMQWVRGG